MPIAALVSSQTTAAGRIENARRKDQSLQRSSDKLSGDSR
jgi:hypothetical protein